MIAAVIPNSLFKKKNITPRPLRRHSKVDTAPRVFNIITGINHVATFNLVHYSLTPSKKAHHKSSQSWNARLQFFLKSRFFRKWLGEIHYWALSQALLQNVEEHQKNLELGFCPDFVLVWNISGWFWNKFRQNPTTLI